MKRSYLLYACGYEKQASTGSERLHKNAKRFHYFGGGGEGSKIVYSIHSLVKNAIASMLITLALSLNDNSNARVLSKIRFRKR